MASLGRVLGNRDTLYKYLNPHLFVVGTVSPSSNSATVYLIDAVSGTIVWSAAHIAEVDHQTGVVATLSDNWLVYAFSDAVAVGKPTRLVSVELYDRSNDSR
jgi:ER membrane protein complex subunit 1